MAAETSDYDLQMARELDALAADIQRAYDVVTATDAPPNMRARIAENQLRKLPDYVQTEIVIRTRELGSMAEAVAEALADQRKEAALTWRYGYPTPFKPGWTRRLLHRAQTRGR